MKDIPPKALIISASAYLAVCVYLSFVPLFNILGYEFSLIFAVTAYITSGLISIIFVKYDERTSGNYISVLSYCLILICIPIVYMTIKGFFITNCNFFEGLAFYILLPVVSVIFSVSLGFFSSSISSKKLYRILIFFTFSLLLIVASTIDLIYGPTVNLYNHIFGYVAGPIYDEVVEISRTLILFRLYTITLSAILVLAGILIIKFKKGPSTSSMAPFIYLLILATAASLLFMIKAKDFGYKSTTDLIQKRLGNKISTGRFNFYFGSSDRHAIDQIKDEFEFRFRQLSGLLKISPTKKIDIYIYPDSCFQKKMMGARNVLIAKPSAREIHLTVSSPYNLPIKHELTHILAGEFGFPIIKMSPRIALFEGLAEAAQGYHGSLSLHEYASALITIGLNVEISKIMGPAGFWSKQSSIAYISAGSFITYLIDKYGIEKLKPVYGGVSFKESYGKSIDNLAHEWTEEIKKIALTDYQLAIAESVFKPKGIFEKKCAHEVATLVEKSFGSGCGGKKEAANRLSEAFELSGKDPNVMSSLIYLRKESGDCPKAIEGSRDVIKNEASSGANRTNALKILSDCSFEIGNLKGALENYKALEGDISVSIGDLLETSVKLEVIGEQANAGILKSFIREKDPLKKMKLLKELPPNTATGDLLTTKLYFDIGDYENCYKFGSQIKGKMEPERLEVFRLKMLVISGFYTGKSDKISQFLDNLSKIPNQASLRIFCDDWRERIAFTQGKISL